MAHVSDWTRESLEIAGFEGFIPLATLSPSAPPRSPGVYMILRVDRSAPTFLKQSIAGRFKGVDSTVETSLLDAKWVQDASVLYIGKARWGTNKDGLRRRLSQYRRHGAGKAVGHRGGECIWQLADSEGLLVCWKVVPDEQVGQIVADLIRDFVTHFGRWPFANRRD